MKSSQITGLVGAICLALLSIPANAQATRTWVSGAIGNDGNQCSGTSPCATFAEAISKTAAGGEINCLDPAGFGTVTIKKSISNVCGTAGDAGVLKNNTRDGAFASGVSGARSCFAQCPLLARQRPNCCLALMASRDVSTQSTQRR
jgi:hypothetical protein